MWALLQTFSWQELRHHPWRNGAAVVAVVLGVALAFAVHLINASALSEFAKGLRDLGGGGDLQLSSSSGYLPEAVYALVSAQPEVLRASPVLEVNTYAQLSQDAALRKAPIRLLGVDTLVIAPFAPELMPIPAPPTARSPASPEATSAAQSQRLSLFAPRAAYLNASARKLLGSRPLALQKGMQWQTVQLAGSVGASGGALVVMDIGSAQELFDQQGQLTRIDLVLHPGANPATLSARLRGLAGWPVSARFNAASDSAAAQSGLSRAYRVNLSVLALVALFTGAFLVFSVLALSVAQRAPQLALLGVLGFSARDRMRLVMTESLLLGLVGSLLGLALGTGLAALALGQLGGDLGGGYFTHSAPPLQWSAGAALLYAALGVLAAALGGWWPARTAQLLPVAQTLKGLGNPSTQPHRHSYALILIAIGIALTRLNPVFGIPIGAYAAIAMLLLGGITVLPGLINLVLTRLAPHVQHHALGLLALERARRVRESATVAVSGVVAALSLAVALTVMVASFRTSMLQWLDVVLPADLYVRSASSSNAADTAWLSADFVQAAAHTPGVAKVRAGRASHWQPNPALPAVTVLARVLARPAQGLPLVAPPLRVPAGAIGIYVSEAMAAEFALRPGLEFPQFLAYFRPLSLVKQGDVAHVFVAGVWRDYARQSSALVLPLADFQRHSGDHRVNDLALWLKPDAPATQVQAQLRLLARQTAGPDSDSVLEFAATQAIRQRSMQIFDRSFAVTYWLQAVAVGIGLFGVAASFSAQVLARRKEFGLLAHLGLTRPQIARVVALEGASWTAIGTLAGLALGLGIAMVLIKVVNPQSFHWSMDIDIPWGHLGLLAASVVAAATLTAWFSARAASSRDSVMAVKEDW